MKPDSKIKMVNGLKIRDLILHEGHIYRVIHFPTRNIVAADLIHENYAPVHNYTTPRRITLSRRAVSTNFNNMVTEYITSDRNSVFTKK
jgi:hypothetical protein